MRFGMTWIQLQRSWSHRSLLFIWLTRAENLFHYSCKQDLYSSKTH